MSLRFTCWQNRSVGGVLHLHWGKMSILLTPSVYNLLLDYFTPERSPDELRDCRVTLVSLQFLDPSFFFGSHFKSQKVGIVSPIPGLKPRSQGSKLRMETVRTKEWTFSPCTCCEVETPTVLLNFSIINIPQNLWPTVYYSWRIDGQFIYSFYFGKWPFTRVGRVSWERSPLRFEVTK